MPAALCMQISDDQRAAVERHFEATHDAETRLRYQMVLLAADGYRVPQIAPLVRRSTATVTRVLHRYGEKGDAGVPYRPRPGRPVARPAAWTEELCRVIEEDPHTVGVKSANWTTALLVGYLAQHSGHRTGQETVRLALHAAGYVCKRPTWTLEPKATDQPEWAKNA
jgi:transposase